MKLGKTNREKNEEIERLISKNLELSGYNISLKRACGNALSFFENYRLSHLHEMSDKEIKLSYKYLQEMQEVLDEEEEFIKESLNFANQTTVSDEEIGGESRRTMYRYGHNMASSAFMDGAKWMREKLTK
jgi:hypothetical protein